MAIMPLQRARRGLYAQRLAAAVKRRCVCFQWRRRAAPTPVERSHCLREVRAVCSLVRSLSFALHRCPLVCRLRHHPSLTSLSRNCRHLMYDDPEQEEHNQVACASRDFCRLTLNPEA